jgi:hypothetical protein
LTTVALSLRGDNRRVAVVGGGIAGLATAFFLTEAGVRDIVVFERSDSFGGRAAVRPELGEHCPRMLLPDYRRTHALLSRIPGVDGVSTVADSVVRVRRMEWVPSGQWVELDHINRFRASELSLRDHLAMLRRGRQPPLVSGVYGPNRNVFGSKRQYSPRAILKMVLNIWRTDRVFAFPGSTERFLIAPIVDHLRARGVDLRPGHTVEKVVTGETSFDSVVLALFPTDLAALLDESGIPHRIDTSLTHAQCKVLTIDLDERERVLADARPMLFCRAGFAILVQPAARRCVVLCTRVASTDDAYVLAVVREFLDLTHDCGPVRVTENQAPSHGVWSATMPTAARVLPDAPPGLHLAGSWLDTGYPYDSTESAVRSAETAAQLSISSRSPRSTPAK